MKAIRVEDFHRSQLVEDVEQLRQALAQRYSHNANQFVIYEEGNEYPMLSVYAREDIAALYYMPTEQEMFASIGNMKHDDAAVEFYDGDELVNQIDASQVVPWPSAIACIEDFCNNLSRSSAIEWTQLS